MAGSIKYGQHPDSRYVNFITGAQVHSALNDRNRPRTLKWCTLHSTCSKHIAVSMDGSRIFYVQNMRSRSILCWFTRTRTHTCSPSPSPPSGPPPFSCPPGHFNQRVKTVRCRVNPCPFQRILDDGIKVAGDKFLQGDPATSLCFPLRLCVPFFSLCAYVFCTIVSMRVRRSNSSLGGPQLLRQEYKLAHVSMIAIRECSVL